MSRRSLLNCVVLLALACPVALGQQVPPNDPLNTPTAKGEDQSHPGGVEILSDTGGVDVRPYVKLILGVIYKHWVPLIPAEAKPPESKPAESAVRFTILPNGRIGAMHLDSSTEDDQINRSCWGAITSTGPFPPLPAGMESKPLELRIHFYVNMQPD
jgi:TonB family protein